MMERVKVTNKELRIYQRIKDMKVDSEDKQDFMRIIGDKAVKELLDNIHEVK